MSSQPIRPCHGYAKATFHFNSVTFEEISSDKIYTFMGAITPSKMLSNRQYLKYAELANQYPFMTISDIKFRLSSIQPLNDELGGIGSSPYVTSAAVNSNLPLLHAQVKEPSGLGFALVDGGERLGIDLGAKITEPGGEAGTMLQAFDGTSKVYGASQWENLEVWPWASNWASYNYAYITSNLGYDVDGLVDFSTSFNFTEQNFKPHVCNRLMDRATWEEVRIADGPIEFTIPSGLSDKVIYTHNGDSSTSPIHDIFGYKAATSTTNDAFYCWPGKYRPLRKAINVWDKTLALMDCQSYPERSIPLFSAPPIKKGDGTQMKLRYWCKCEYSGSISFFDDTNIGEVITAEGDADPLLGKQTRYRISPQHWAPSTTGVKQGADGEGQIFFFPL